MWYRIIIRNPVSLGNVVWIDIKIVCFRKLRYKVQVLPSEDSLLYCTLVSIFEHEDKLTHYRKIKVQFLQFRWIKNEFYITYLNIFTLLFFKIAQSPKCLIRLKY